MRGMIVSALTGLTIFIIGLIIRFMPEDDRDSGSRRVLHLVDGLQHAGWAVTFVSQHANPNPRYVRAMQQRGIDVYAGATAWMDQLIATQGYELIAFGLWDVAEPYVPRIRARSPRSRVIVDSIDLHFLRRARQTFQESSERGGVGVLQHRAQFRIHPDLQGEAESGSDAEEVGQAAH